MTSKRRVLLRIALAYGFAWFGTALFGPAAVLSAASLRPGPVGATEAFHFEGHVPAPFLVRARAERKVGGRTYGESRTHVVLPGAVLRLPTRQSWVR